MDKPANPATPFGEVYQAFYDDLVKQGTKPPVVGRPRQSEPNLADELEPHVRGRSLVDG
jgi:hypothetical protein